MEINNTQNEISSTSIFHHPCTAHTMLSKFNLQSIFNGEKHEFNANKNLHTQCVVDWIKAKAERACAWKNGAEKKCEAKKKYLTFEDHKIGLFLLIMAEISAERIFIFFLPFFSEFSSINEWENVDSTPLLFRRMFSIFVDSMMAPSFTWQHMAHGCLKMDTIRSAWSENSCVLCVVNLFYAF